MADPETPTEEAFDFGKKKSKKSKHKAIEELVEETAAVVLDDADIDPDAPVAGGDELNFGKKKKKKSKEAGEGEAEPVVDKKEKKEAEVEEEAGTPEEAPAERGEGDEGMDEADLEEEEARMMAEGGEEDEEEGAEGEDDERAEAEARKLLAEAEQETWLGSDRDYTYPELLSRVFRILRENNPELMGEKRKYTIPPPNVQREGSKKTLFANIVEICQRMKRSPEHVIQYLFAELGTTGSVAGAGQLIIKGRFQQKGIENVLKRYIGEYVTCKVCRSPNTRLTRGENRLYFIECDNCHSKRSVQTVKTGFQAQVGRRAAQRKG